MQLKKQHVGRINLPMGTVDIAAPYAAQKSKYRLALEVVAGPYDCYVLEGKADRDWKQRPWIAQIVTADRRLAPIADRKILTGRNWKRIGCTSVGDCMTGFFDRKPEFEESHMEALCKRISDRNWQIHSSVDLDAERDNPLHSWCRDAFLVQNSSRNGAVLDVYGIKDKNQIIALQIRFGTPRIS